MPNRAWTPKIAEICKKHHLLLFEDNAQGFGCSTTLSDSISCANGTDALKLMLMGELAIGNLQKGDEVIVPANTYFATVLAISSVGLTPVLVDANIDTLQIDDQLIEARITPKTKAITISLPWKPEIFPPPTSLRNLTLSPIFIFVFYLFGAKIQKIL